MFIVIWQQLILHQIIHYKEQQHQLYQHHYQLIVYMRIILI